MLVTETPAESHTFVPSVSRPNETGFQPVDPGNTGRYLVPLQPSRPASTQPSLPTTFTGYTSTFSGEPGPGYLMGKALYWTGNRVIAAFEMFNINARVRNHIEYLRKKRTPSRDTFLDHDVLFQILDDALELSKPYYPTFVNNYSIRLYYDYAKFLKRRPFPREFLQTISSAMLTLSVIAWLVYQNYEQGLPTRFIKDLFKICTKRPVRLHNSDEISATRTAISPHLTWLIPLHLRRRPVSTSWISNFQVRKGEKATWLHLDSTSGTEVGARLCTFISSFPWLAVTTYEANHAKSGNNLSSNILGNFESSFFAWMDSGSGWTAFMVCIEAYCSLICTGMETRDSNFLRLDEIVRNTIHFLCATVTALFIDPFSSEDTKAWRAFKKNSTRNAAMERLVELLIWIRCELPLHGSTVSGPSQEYLLKLWKAGLSNISLFEASHLSSSNSVPAMDDSIVEGDMQDRIQGLATKTDNPLRWGRQLINTHS